MKVVGIKRQIPLLCDSWYSKAEVVDLDNQFESLELICNVRVDTVLFHLPPARNGKHGRPQKHGDRLELEKIPLSKLKSGNYLIGVCSVITKLWKDKVVYALVTTPKMGKGSCRLFLCTKNPKEISFDLERCTDEPLRECGQKNRLRFPLAWYDLC